MLGPLCENDPLYRSKQHCLYKASSHNKGVRVVRGKDTERDDKVGAKKKKSLQITEKKVKIK